METLTQERDLLKDTTYRLRQYDIPALEVYFEAEKSVFTRYMTEYFSHHYNVMLKNGFFSPSEYKAEKAVMPEVCGQPFDLYIKISRQGQGYCMQVSGIKENHVPIDPLVFATEYSNLRQVVNRFSANFMTAYYQTMHEMIQKEVEELNKDISSMEKTAEDLPYKIAMQRSLIEQLRNEVYEMEKNLRKNNRELDNRQRTLQTKNEELEKLKNKLLSI